MRIMRTLSVLAAIAISALPALAAEADGYPAKPKEVAIAWSAILYAVIFAAAIAVVAFKNAKRTHLD